MPVGIDTAAYRRRLPHLAKRDRTYYVTFCTRDREILLPPARDIVMGSCIHDHDRMCWLDCVTVMPDHVHLIVTPYETTSITNVLERMKGASVHLVNRLLARAGSLWQEESFDRMIRSHENLAKKREYIFNNSVRWGLVERWQDYPWTWSPP